MRTQIKKEVREWLMNESLETSNIFYHGSPYEFDRFDFNRVGSGDGLSKFGYGLYFADDRNTAIYYAKELSKGNLKPGGFNLYTVKLLNFNEYYNWEDETPHHVAECIIRKLIAMGKENDAEQIISEYEDYGNYWELRNMYDTLSYVLGDKKKTTEFLYSCGVSGVIGQSPSHDGNIFVSYSDNVKIIDSDKL